MPDLSFKIEEAASFHLRSLPRSLLSFASPTQIAETIHTVALRCQIQIDVTRRRYTAGRTGEHARSLWRAGTLEPDAAQSAVDPCQRRRSRLHRAARLPIFRSIALSTSTLQPQNILKA